MTKHRIRTRVVKLLSVRVSGAPGMDAALETALHVAGRGWLVVDWKELDAGHVVVLLKETNDERRAREVRRAAVASPQ